MTYTPEEPIAAIATALSPAALGIVRASGRGAVELMAQIFSRPQALAEAQSPALVYGWIIDPATKAKIDQVMTAVYRSPKSFTGEDMTEIFCHGGVAVVTRVYRLLLANGFRSASPGEFTFRAYLNNKIDLTRAEAIREITEAKTAQAQSRAAGRLAGTLWDEIEEIKRLLIQTRAAIEAETEYPEDENAVAGDWDNGQLREAEQRLAALSASWASEKLYQDGARVVLCGRTNAGKSSLFNTLLKEDRAIVSDAHGTTRDWLESWASFEGLPVRLFDTAGLRETGDPVERSGVERALDLAKDADCILYLVDGKMGITREDQAFLANPPEKTPVILVYNKVDKISKIIYIQQSDVCRVSAKTGAGIPALIAAVRRVLGGVAGSEDRAASLGSARQQRVCEEALQSARNGLFAGERGFPLDAVTQDIDDALTALGEITGSVTPEDILETVFSTFCVGK
jgi:tRNA modification GTPase